MRVDRLLLRLNILFLPAVSFLPFPTRLVAEALEKSTDFQRVAAVVYGVTLLVIRLLFAGLTAYSRRSQLRRPGPDDPDLQDARRKFLGAALAYVVTICIGLLAPTAAIACYFAIAVFLIVPFREVARIVLPGRSA